MPQLILYDLPSKDRCACWSLNPWKTRLSLNYKNVDYKTEWLEYPDIAPKFKSTHLQPNADGFEYTIPIVRLEDGTYIMDSFPIAEALEAAYPVPSLCLDYENLQDVIQHTTELSQTTNPCWIAKVPRNILLPRSSEYFQRTRHEKFGMSLDDLEKERGIEEKWAEAKPAAEALGQLLRTKDGPFYMGETVSYADFVTVGFLQCVKRIDKNSFERIISLEHRLQILYDACGELLSRDDH